MPTSRRTLPMRLALAMVALCTAPGGLAGVGVQQAPAITRAEEVDALLQSAEKLLNSRQFADALQPFERVLESARRLGLPLQEAQALCALGDIHFNRSRYADARAAAAGCAEIYGRLAAGAQPQNGAPVARGIARSNYLISVIAWREGNRTEARQRAEAAIAAYEAVADRRGRALATLHLIRVGDLDDAGERVLRDRIIDDARAIGDRVIEAQARHSFGDYLFTIGHYAEALGHLEAAAALFEATGRLVDLGTTYNSLGRLYRAHGRIDAALASQLKALAIHEKAGQPFTHGQSLNAVAVTYQALGDSRRARHYFERALTVAEQASTPKIQDSLRANFASTLLEEGDYQKGADILEGVVGRGLDSFPGMRMGDLAFAYLRLGRPDVAMGWAQKAVDACGEREADCVASLNQRAQAHAALGNDAAALADLQSAMASIENLRSRLVPADFFKQQFHHATEDLYSRAIAIQVRRGEAADALETAERARARAFVDLLASRDMPLAPDARSSVPLVFRGAARTASGSGTAGGDLLSDAAIPAATSADLVATAARLRSTLVSYWVVRDQVFIWVVTPNGTVRALQVDIRRSTLLELIRATAPFRGTEAAAVSEPKRTALPARGEASIALGATPSDAWRALYDLLIKPVRSSLPRTRGALLTIVPHGPLGALAFAGLQDERGRYLLEDYAIHYAPSGTTLQFTAGRRRDGARTGNVLMVTDPLPPTLSNLDRPLPRLPGARAEGRAIASLLPRARLTRFEGDGARESAVRDASAGKAVLHFATHAIVRDDDPFASFLALTRSGNEDDGLLTAQEIYRLKLDADLVVLSACRSAEGRVTGDGIATFARAFIYAGAPSIVASLWDVADEPTNRLLPEFYRRWLRGTSKAGALRAAQLRLLKDLRDGRIQVDTPAGRVSLPNHPVFWAGFGLIGEPE
jgi:CHAT domain-containing protein/tetratricopeptide (TPR) repeat protein